jgi:hypothetical protein
LAEPFLEGTQLSADGRRASADVLTMQSEVRVCRTSQASGPR